jgi:ribonuclease D
LKAVLQVSIKKGHARTNWAQRPLPAQLIEYAHADVEHLVQLGLTLMERLDKLGRKDWALELTSKWEEVKLYQADPEGIAERLSRGGKLDQKGYAVLIELIRWREERVRALNLPRRWVADDPVMVDLAQVRPKDLNHLSSFRGLSKGELKNNGEALLEAIKRGEANASSLEPPKRNQKLELPNESESQVLNLLQTYVSILADEHQIAVKHLVTSAQLLPLFRSQAVSSEDWVKQGLLSAGAARLVGDEILAMLQGKRVLSVAPKGRSLAVQVTQKS